MMNTDGEKNENVEEDNQKDVLEENAVHVITSDVAQNGEKRQLSSPSESIDVEEKYRKKSKNIKKLCEAGDLSSVKELIKIGEKADEACVYRAAKSGHSELIEYLLEDLKTNFNASTFSVVKNSRIMILLLKHENLLNPAKNAEDKREILRAKNIASSVRGSKKFQKEEEALLKLCKESTLEEVRAHFESQKAIVTRRAIGFATKEKKRELFGVLIDTIKSFLETNDKLDGSEQIDMKVIEDILALGWKEEAEKLMKKGLRYSHKDIDLSNEELAALLRQFPRNLIFPFTAISVWFRRNHSESFMGFTEKAIATKDKIAKLFSKESQESMEEKDRDYVEAFRACIESYLSMGDDYD